MRATVLALAASLAFAAGVGLADVPKDEPGTVEAEPLSVWTQDAGGGFTHLQSGLSCPMRLGEFHRRQIELFDNFGLDVGCDYLDPGNLDVTVYLTRRTKTNVGDAMTEARRELEKTRADLNPQFVSQSRSTLDGLDFDVAVYSLGASHSAIWIGDLDGWTLEYRATYPAADEVAARADLDAFTQVVQGSAGAQLGLCAKGQPPKRTGSFLPETDKDQGVDATLSGILAVSGEAAAEDKGNGQASQPPPQPITWCLEAVIPGEHNVLFWRGVLPDGSDADVDRVTALTKQAPPVLTVQSDAALAAVMSELHKPARWQASIDSEGRSSLYGYFTDRPSPQTLTSLYLDILAGRAHPLSSYDRAHKTIEISMPPSH